MITGAIALFALIATGCGGGGGNGGVATPTGSVQGYVDTGAVARIAGRSAALTPVSGATIVASTGARATSGNNGFFTLNGIPAGNYISITATKGSLTLKSYINVTAGTTITKNIDARTTAAGMIYEKLRDQSLTASAPADPASIESSELASDIETEIETAINADSFNYSTVASGASVSEAVSRISSGGSLTDRTPPEITFSNPGSSTRISDVDFRDQAFFVQLGYSDAAPLHTGNLKITLSMDGGDETDVTSYFTQPDSASIKSNGFYQYTRTLFNLASNDEEHTITIRVTAEDASGNSQFAGWSFTVYPQAPPSQ